MSNRTVLQIALAFVLVVWGVAMLTTLLVPTHKTPEGLVGGMTGIAGGIIYALGKTKDDDDNHTPPSTGGTT